MNLSEDEYFLREHIHQGDSTSPLSSGGDGVSSSTDGDQGRQRGSGGSSHKAKKSRTRSLKKKVKVGVLMTDDSPISVR